MFETYMGIPKCFSQCVGWAIGAGLLCLSQVTHADDLLGGAAEGLTIAQYNSSNSSVIVLIKADRLFTDYEHHGFFRIGLLPIPVAENVKIQIASPDCLTEALAQLQERDLASTAVHRLELRKLEIAIMGETQPRLTASLARVGDAGTLELFDVSLFSPEGSRLSIIKGALQITGSSAGRLSWNVAGRIGELFPLNHRTKAL